MFHKAQGSWGAGAPHTRVTVAHRPAPRSEHGAPCGPRRNPGPCPQRQPLHLGRRHANAWAHPRHGTGEPGRPRSWECPEATVGDTGHKEVLRVRTRPQQPPGDGTWEALARGHVPFTHTWNCVQGDGLWNHPHPTHAMSPETGGFCWMVRPSPRGGPAPGDCPRGAAVRGAQGHSAAWWAGAFSETRPQLQGYSQAPH